MSSPKQAFITESGAFRAVWSLVVVAVVLVVAVGINITYTNHVQHQDRVANEKALAKSEQVWCGVLIRILAPDAPPPATERAWQVFKGLVDLARAYGCQNVPHVPPKPTPAGRSGIPSPSTTATSSG